MMVSYGATCPALLKPSKGSKNLCLANWFANEISSTPDRSSFDAVSALSSSSPQS